MILSPAWFATQYQALQGTADLWVAYSGGLDSSVLLELCYLYANANPVVKLQAVHIHHGLQPAADSWAEHCENKCLALGIPCHICRVKIDLNAKASVEALARQARHTVWQELLPPAATLLLAQHAADQAETILQRLFRGAGPTGLSGMAAHRKFGNGWLIRPFLTIAKPEIAAFAKLYGVTWIEDNSNQDQKFERNYIRHTILPKIAQQWPQAITNITRSGELCQQLVTRTVAETDELLSQCGGSVINTLAIDQLVLLAQEKRHAVLRAWIAKQHYQMPSYQQLTKITSEVILAKNTVTPKLQCSQYIIRRYRNDLYLTALAKTIMPTKYLLLLADCPAALTTELGLLQLQQLPGQGFKLPAGEEKLTIIIGNSVGRTAKKIFQRYGIPPWQRKQYPLVFAGSSLVQIIGLWLRPTLLTTASELGYVLAFDS